MEQIMETLVIKSGRVNSMTEIASLNLWKDNAPLVYT